jgi:beta-glucosidase
MASTFIFPKDFIWGTATSSYQTEGNITNNDWYEWEQNKKPDEEFPKEHCGIACDSYNRYEEDFDLAVKLNNNSIRISVEWARIQPSEDTFDQNEIEHYKKVLKAAKSRNLKTFVTLHHFTNPLWFSKKSGWANLRAPSHFEKYAKKCAEEFGDLIDVYLTINEPDVFAFQAYVKGIWPPNKEDLFLPMMIQTNMARAHIKAYKAIKSVGDYPVGVVKNIVWFEPAPGKYRFFDNIVSKVLYYVNDDLFLKPMSKYMDLIGLNYYFTTRLKKLLLNNVDDVQSDLGWWVNPAGLEKVLLKLKRYNLPIYITENGVADQIDRIRIKFIKDMLGSTARAMKQGVNVKGYFYWSLLDNYEWHQGYWPKFGLVYVDRNHNLERIPRESFYYYADICVNGRIEV